MTRLATLQKGQKVQIQNMLMHEWDSIGVIKDICNTGQSYLIEESSGAIKKETDNSSDLIPTIQAQQENQTLGPY